MTLMPEFRQQLLEAAAERHPEPGRRIGAPGGLRSRLAWVRPRVGAPLAIVASLLIVVAVGAVVLTIGRAHHRSGTPADQRSGAAPGVAASRAQLLGELGALRGGRVSPLPGHFSLPVSQMQIDRSSVRTVASAGYTVTLIPVTVPVRGSSPRRRTTELVVTVQGPRVPSGFPALGEGSTVFANPVSPAMIARQGAVIVMYVRGPLNRAVVIVPDGVTRVALSRFMPLRSSGGRIAAIAPAAASVHDNVAVISLSGVTAAALHQTHHTVANGGGLFSSRRCHVNAVLYFVPVSARMTWWRTTASGTEARTTTIDTDLNGYSTTLLPRIPCRRSRGR